MEVFPSRIEFESADEPSRISKAAIRPPPIFFRSCWAMTALSDSARTTRTWSCSSSGKASMTRSMTFAGGVGVQRGEDEEPGLRGGQRHPDRLEVAHLADEKRVGVFAQRGLHAAREIGDVRPDLALGEDGLVVDVDELDGVLDRDDVAVDLLVDPVEDRRERRRFARARRSGDENEAARIEREIRDRGRKAELLDGRNLRRNQPEERRRAVLLLEQVRRGNGPRRPSGTRSRRRRSA